MFKDKYHIPNKINMNIKIIRFHKRLLVLNGANISSK